jgi:deoxycytidine triphosphate deaminase
MATILNDAEIKKLIGTVIIDGDPGCIRPNAYIMRLGGEGEFLNSEKEFILGKNKTGIIVQPSHSVALTAFETIDFRRETVHNVYPDHDLHGILSPTTDLSREGIVAPTTQVDAGYRGTLNWTITNTSNEERRFLYKERIYRLVIFKLAPGETPSRLYEGDYQEQMGYVRSRRKGPPVGMREEEWENSIVEGGPEKLLDHLMKSGFPWAGLGQKLKQIDLEFKTVTTEYAQIHESIEKLSREVDDLHTQRDELAKSIPETIRNVLRDESMGLQNRWLLAGGTMLAAALGLILALFSNQRAWDFVKSNGVWLGVVIIIASVCLGLRACRSPGVSKK